MALKKRAKGKNVYAVGCLNDLRSKSQVFSKEQELDLYAHIKNMSSRMYVLTTLKVLSLAFHLANYNKTKKREENSPMNPKNVNG